MFVAGLFPAAHGIGPPPPVLRPRYCPPCCCCGASWRILPRQRALGLLLAYAAYMMSTCCGVSISSRRGPRILGWQPCVLSFCLSAATLWIHRATRMDRLRPSRHLAGRGGAVVSIVAWYAQSLSPVSPGTAGRDAPPEQGRSAYGVFLVLCMHCIHRAGRNHRLVYAAGPRGAAQPRHLSPVAHRPGRSVGLLILMGYRASPWRPWE